MKPVAWGWYDLEIKQFFPFWDENLMENKEGCIPLYTAPRELSDEEINKLWAESHEDGIAMQQGFTTQQHYFAHLILKKASEK
jgi:hypothetical protein